MTSLSWGWPLNWHSTICHICPRQSAIIHHYNVLFTGKRDINALRVKCTNEEKGCNWKGTIGILKEHVATCELALLLCPNQCIDDSGDFRHVLRKELSKHLEKDCPKRDFECAFCGEKGKIDFISDIHDKVCRWKILPCPNTECTATVERQRVKRHLDICLYTEVPCKYQKLGCEVRMKRNVLPAHESEDKLHLRMALDTVVALQESVRVLKDGESMAFELAEYEKKREEGVVCCSPEFYTSSKGYLMKVRVFANGKGSGEGTHLSVYIKILKGKYDDELKWPFVGKVTISLLNQLDDASHVTQELLPAKDVNFTVGDSRGYVKFWELSELIVGEAQYLKDDKLFFRVKVKVEGHRPWLE